MTSIDSPFPNTARDYYDYMIIDNPPDIAFNVIAALKITDEVIVPVKIDEWALEGLDIIADQIKQARQINRKIKMLGVLATMYRNNDANNAGLEWLAEKSPVKLLGKIRYTDKAAESTFLSKSSNYFRGRPYSFYHSDRRQIRTACRVVPYFTADV